VARLNEWQRETLDARRRETWTLSGPNRLVKVTPLVSDVRTHVGGYITIGRYLVGKTPQEMELELGLRKDDLLHGARIYKLARLPQPSEYTYELTTEFPGGLAYNPAFSHPYRVGSRSILQWQIREGVHIPVKPGFLPLGPQTRFPYWWLLK